MSSTSVTTRSTTGPTERPASTEVHGQSRAADQRGSTRTGRVRRDERRPVMRRRPPGRPPEAGPWLPARPGVRGGWVRPDGDTPVAAWPGSGTSGSAVRPAAPGPVRLSLRGRRLRAAGLAVLVLWLVGAVLVPVAGAAAGAVTGAGDPSPGAAIVVQAGDTLWGVAERTAPGQDPRQVVAQLRALNDLPGGRLRAGQLIVLPAA